MVKILTRTITAVVAGYLLMCVAMYLIQDVLLFHPRPNHPGAVAELANVAFELPIRDSRNQSSRTLRGWRLPAPVPAEAPLLLYFGGQAEDLATTALHFRRMQHLPANVVLVNYAGYGSSEGVPSEQTFESDAVAVFDSLKDGSGYNGQVLAMGRSLGTGVAVALASARPVSGAFLVSPYDSIRAIAAERFPWLPVGWLIKHPFDAQVKARLLSLPVTFVVATGDRVVPVARSEQLARSWSRNREGSDTAVVWVRVTGVTHNNIQRSEDYTAALFTFLQAFEAPVAPSAASVRTKQHPLPSLPR